MVTSGLTELYMYLISIINKNADLQDCMDILHLYIMQWDGICHVLLYYHTCFQSIPFGRQEHCMSRYYINIPVLYVQ